MILSVSIILHTLGKTFAARPLGRKLNAAFRRDKFQINWRASFFFSLPAQRGRQWAERRHRLSLGPFAKISLPAENAADGREARIDTHDIPAPFHYL